MLEETLRSLNTHWTKELEYPGIKREAYLKKMDRFMSIQKAIILFGLRRVGKTTLMHQFLWEKMREMKPSRLFFATLDHPEICNVSLLDLLKEFRRMTITRSDEPQILFLDEVQKRKGFETELKMIIDIEPDTRVVASGSSSLVVRHESSAMTGRYMKMEVRPLDFSDYLKFNGYDLDRTEPALMEGLMDEYLIDGGMPQYVKHKEPALLLDIIDDVIYKDILGMYSVDDPKLLKDMFFLLMNRTGRPLSYSKIARLMGLGVDTVKRYIGYFEECYLIHIVEREGKPNERKYSPKKLYAPDNGIAHVASGNRDMGPLAENAAFLQLRRLGNVGYLNRDGREIDFVVRDKAFEVKYKDKVEEREIETLTSLIKKKYKEKFVITRRAIDPIKDVKAIPLWRLETEISEGL